MLLHGWSGMITQSVNVLRNLLSAYGKMSRVLSVVFVVVNFCIGYYVNNRGILGLLPLLASAEYTFCLPSKNMCILKSGLMINMIMWAIYDFHMNPLSVETKD